MLCETRLFLERYAVAVRMLRLCRIDEKERQSTPGEATYYGRVGGTAEYWQNQLIEIREFIESLPNESCKLLLYYHYVVGMTVERASEELDISRRNAFRLKKRALAFAAARLNEWRRQRVRQSS
jgi:DNA-directed RNA polymerase specialized sigma24 family protein